MSKNLLIVEDDIIIQMFLERSIQSMGYRVVGVYDNGDDALELLDDNIIHYAILDVKIMGDLNGVQTALKIKEIDPTIQIIFLTGNMDFITLELMKSVQPVCILSKPISYKSLEENLLQLHHM